MGAAVPRCDEPTEGTPNMKLLKLGWVGTRTEHSEAMADFFGRILGLRFVHGGEDMWVFQLPDGSKVEVFGPSQNEHFTTGPVVEFFTDDVAGATDELRAAGIPIVSGPVFWEGEDDVAWVHFRAPDGNVYGITQGRDLTPPQG
jgi:catechol 2,3-dioxygenase-like lactoylglutathione lyase family enzyme